MIIKRTFTRRSALRGVAGGIAATVGLPFLDAYLNDSGTALADGTPLPVRFGCWFQGLGFNPGRWEPQKAGAGYDMNIELEVLQPYKDRINIYSGMKAFLDGKPNHPHDGGWKVSLNGMIPASGAGLDPSLDQVIADKIGKGHRFRSIEASCDGTPTSFSTRGGFGMNPSEASPVALYTRVFGPDFKDPNAADFTPDPKVVLRRSVLSSIGEQRQDLVKEVGASDKARLDEYYTSLRELEQQLEFQLQRPAPLEACSIPDKPNETKLSMAIDDALENNRLLMKIVAHTLACGQTRVFNVNFGNALSNLRKKGSSMTFHMYTHEEAVDPQLGYQPQVTWFMGEVAKGYLDAITALDSIREGDGTLLDRSIVFYATDTGSAKVHSMENLPMITAGRAGGRLKTGYHCVAKGDPATRVGLTIQQALGLPTSTWGRESNQTSKAFGEVLA